MTPGVCQIACLLFSFNYSFFPKMPERSFAGIQTGGYTFGIQDYKKPSSVTKFDTVIFFILSTLLFIPSDEGRLYFLR